MNHVEMKVFPRKENDWNLFSKVVKVKSDLKIVFKWLKCENYISCKDNLENKWFGKLFGIWWCCAYPLIVQ